MCGLFDEGWQLSCREGDEDLLRMLLEADDQPTTRRGFLEAMERVSLVDPLPKTDKP